MNGGLGFTGQSPSAACRSVWQTPLAAILTRIWPGPGFGTGTSSITRGCLNSRTTAAFMVLGMEISLGVKCQQDVSRLSQTTDRSEASDALMRAMPVVMMDP